jgi:hypothetical protein
MDRKKERKVRIVRVEQEQLAQIVSLVARHDGEVGIELVVGLREETAVGAGEYTQHVGEDPYPTSSCRRHRGRA